MTDTTLSSSTSTQPALGPLERAQTSLNAMVLQMGLFAELQKTRADGNLTPDLEMQFANVFAATVEPASA